MIFHHTHILINFLKGYFQPWDSFIQMFPGQHTLIKGLDLEYGDSMTCGDNRLMPYFIPKANLSPIIFCHVMSYNSLWELFWAAFQDFFYSVFESAMSAVSTWQNLSNKCYFSIRLVITESKKSKDNFITIDHFSNRKEQKPIDWQTVAEQGTDKMIETSAIILPAPCSIK